MSRSIYAIYCDDIRHEVNGKTTLVGVYAGKLLVGSFPASLSKLCVVLNLTTPIDDPFQEVSVVGKLSGQEVFQLNVGKEEMAEYNKKIDELKGESKFIDMQMASIMSPIQIDKPGVLSLEVLVNGEPVPCRPLDIGQAQPGQIVSQ
ncbi:hypothetical protein LU689_29155 [Pseudomonas asiatica]|uniref:DUF6941 family protein n=1 Tax=Pseudomonas TaxID=286 RepID=UPI001E2B5850|nr:hypothetical protein [Pseudomonas asiatica]MCE0853972.1 hypothetical protein [Pseudomonas asiatica]